MKIIPFANKIQLEFEEARAGSLVTSSRESAVEYAKVIAISKDLKDLEDTPKIGDYVFVKAWAVDIVTHEDKKYYFCDLDTNGVLAIVK